MTYSLEVSSHIDKILKKLVKKDRTQYEMIMRKVEEILERPQAYKNLHSPLQHWKRVHIMKSFVLTFSVDENKKIVRLEDYEHHDNIYK